MGQDSPFDDTRASIDIPKDFDLAYRELLFKNYERNQGFLNFRYNGLSDKFTTNYKSNLSFKSPNEPYLSNYFRLTSNLFLEKKFTGEITPTKGINFSSELATLNFGGISHDVIGGFNTDTKFEKFKAYLNVSHSNTGKFEHLAGLRFSSNKNKVDLSDRIMLTHHEFRAGLALKFNLCQLGLSRYNAFFGWTTSNKDLTFEHVSEKGSGFNIGELVFSGVFHYPKIDYAACLSVTPDKRCTTLGFSKTINDNVLIQSKIHDFRLLAFNSILKITPKLKVGLGTSIELTGNGISNTIGENSFKVPLSINITFNA